MKTNKKMKQSIIVLGAMFLLGTVGFAEYSIITNEISKSQQALQIEIQKAIKESKEESKKTNEETIPLNKCVL